MNFPRFVYFKSVNRDLPRTSTQIRDDINKHHIYYGKDGFLSERTSDAYLERKCQEEISMDKAAAECMFSIKKKLVMSEEEIKLIEQTDPDFIEFIG